MKRATLARMIDHTLLKPEATPAEIERLCAEAAEHGFATVCVNPIYVALAANLLHGTPVAVCTVAGFPLGATPTPVKRFEALQVLDDGAVEVDMVIPIGRLKAGQHDVVRDDIYALAQLCHEQGALLKVILENALLTDDEKVSACRLAVEAGADFVKTSTGFARSGATVADVALMRQTVGPEIGVKAAGGIRTYADALAMIEAGANRLGASASLKILEEAEE
ncbi:MAG: deoxyribose-phosphate aldolase [Chloroflexi bacterium]|nr:deoxyribose-phosphate aldolase [Chloroflexota bacterium]HOS79524.1 deoxyribose-phosphate aldolase [Anaerolineae bacterium]HQE99339.1 deoxyribose-phosphate aldolase [Anaerolineae bacterium]HQJ11862.1 deoxyribose-phosphate aldolase [Anaerolineae bacterium]HUM36821.1 deoxyribose-phosphate aldolase [Anaerolineae bacterium]